MSDDEAPIPKVLSPKVLSPEAQRALAEAEARRQAAQTASLPPELGGPKGPEPTLHGDWAFKGIACDF